jgi:phage terminase small subunit
MFIENFQGTYEHPSTVETLKTIKKKHDESLQDYVKHFCNARNAIPYIQDIEIINAFHDGVSDIKTMEEITMKKPEIVVDLLTVTDVCIEALKAQARLLESRGKGASRKKEDREVNIADRGDHKDRGDCGHHDKQSLELKEKRSFQCPDDAEK